MEEEDDLEASDGVYLFEDTSSAEQQHCANCCCAEDDLLECANHNAGFLVDVDDIEDDEDAEEDTEEALLVLQDERGRRKPKCTTKFDEEEYVGDPV